MKPAVGIDAIGNNPELYIGDCEPPELVRKCLANAEFAVVFKPQSVDVRNREG